MGFRGPSQVFSDFFAKQLRDQFAGNAFILSLFHRNATGDKEIWKKNESHIVLECPGTRYII